MSILIIEDDLNWALKLEIMLVELGHTIQGTCTSVLTARETLKCYWPEIIVCDVLLEDGTFMEVFEGKKIPDTTSLILVTNSPENKYYKDAQNLGKVGFLVKPFHALTLQSAIDLVKPEIAKNPTPKVGLDIRGNHGQIQTIPFEQIWWIQAQGNYCSIFTEHRKYALKTSLRKLLLKLDNHFLQVHKAFVINTIYAGRIEISNQIIYVKGNPIPTGRRYQRELLSALSS